MPEKRDNSKQIDAMAEAKYKFHSEEELRGMIDDYFNECHETGRLTTEQGLALKLGVHTDTLHRWLCETSQTPQHVVKYIPVLKEAYERLSDEFQQMLLTGEKNMTSFVIFALKQKLLGGYQDKIEQKNETTVKVKFGDGLEYSDFR